MVEIQGEKRFGTVAVEMGFITIDQLLHAMNVQIKEDIELGEHRLLGTILVEMGAMTKKQVKEVLLAMGAS